ncbi:MAG: nitroreductase [Mucilaginibacter polytrichastri]|nr:nitroreductase [Mucilaginibacter polytrichastri]
MSAFNDISALIRNRRTVKADQMNGTLIPDEQVQQLLELANWAPTHAFTEPWRFTVYAGEGKKTFCRAHAEMYRTNTPADKFAQPVFERLAAMGEKVSHIIVAKMKRHPAEKIPAMEEIAATACAIQNLVLAGEALGISTFWSTGGMALKQPMKDFYGLEENDQVMGVLYLGYADAKPEGRRIVPLEEKINWVSE